MFLRNYFLACGAPNTVASVSENTGAQRFYRLRTINGELCPVIASYGVENGGNTTFGNCDSVFYATTHMKVAKSSLIRDTSYSTTTSAPYGVCFGNGTTPVSFEDYTMSGELFTTYSSSQTRTVTYDDTGVTTTILYTLTNTGAEDFTISEIGVFGCVYVKHSSNSRYYRYNILTERTLLETPITIPANGGVGQVSYTFRMDFPK